jgi:hypothetical protein
MMNDEGRETGIWERTGLYEKAGTMFMGRRTNTRL